MNSGSAISTSRFDVYRLALEFQALLPVLVRRAPWALRDQLERAGASVVLNIAEGLGRFAPADKGRFYVIARASAYESSAAVDILLARGRIDVAAHRRANERLSRVAQMLTKLVLRMEARSRAAAVSPQCGIWSQRSIDGALPPAQACANSHIQLISKDLRPCALRHRACSIGARRESEGARPLRDRSGGRASSKKTIKSL